MREHTLFKFCPRCGGDALEGFFKNGMKCSGCGYTYFHNMAAAVAGIIETDRGVIFIRRAHDPRKGFLDLPGGFADYHESLEESLAREIREELSLDVTDIRYFGSSPNTYIYKDISYFTADAFFTCRPLTLDTLKLSDENTECVFLLPAQFNFDDFAFAPMRVMLAKYQQMKDV